MIITKEIAQTVEERILFINMMLSNKIRKEEISIFKTKYGFGISKFNLYNDNVFKSYLSIDQESNSSFNYNFFKSLTYFMFQFYRNGTNLDDAEIMNTIEFFTTTTQDSFEKIIHNLSN